MHLRTIVNRLAKEKKVSVASVARSLGMSPQKFDSYLNGNPRMDNLQKMAEALGVDPKQLMIINDYEPTSQIVNEAPVAYQPAPVKELELLKKQNELLQENYNLQKKEIARLEMELAQCQQSKAKPIK